MTLLSSKAPGPDVGYVLILAMVVLTSCAHQVKKPTAGSVTEEEERIIHAVVAQLPNESTNKPYVIASELFLPAVMVDPAYEDFGQNLRQAAKLHSPPTLSAVEDFLEKNQANRRVSVESRTQSDVCWVQTAELNRLLSTNPKDGRMEWIRWQDKYGNTPRYFRVCRPGMDQSNTTAIIYVGVHYPVGPAYGELHILRRTSKQWKVEHNERIGPTWAF